LFYFTSVYRVALDHRVLWQLIELELLCAGCLFAWPMAAVDPLPKPSGHGTRMMWLLISLPYTTILGMSLDSDRRGLAPGMTVAELHTGGGIVWTVGGLVGLFAVIVVLAQWAGLEQRSALRRDRVLDPEAAAQLAYWKANRLLAAEEAGLVPRRGAGELAVAALGPGGEGRPGAASTPLALPTGPGPVGEPVPDPPE
jgi:cytochrome c oxidase assembly factor CtaG